MLTVEISSRKPAVIRNTFSAFVFSETKELAVMIDKPELSFKNSKKYILIGNKHRYEERSGLSYEIKAA
ncbi:hypothetical protein Q4503_00175 [Colwellia sp. 6_MG-2023]|uniref:hypothetical protein n=1 Tax=Colwellia sp. 6_MG-2023 TaxID=3062676 RepID=UPI0026E1724D|nr:hypothetical protein [Colwellia sp. 6_MG-2023]MDO6486091.1 hypothetical protein [Colwellia sp. 6_MG-2023]